MINLDFQAAVRRRPETPPSASPKTHLVGQTAIEVQVVFAAVLDLCPPRDYAAAVAGALVVAGEDELSVETAFGSGLPGAGGTPPVQAHVGHIALAQIQQVDQRAAQPVGLLGFVHQKPLVFVVDDVLHRLGSGIIGQQCDFLSAEGTGAAAQFLLAKGNFDYGGDIAGNVSVHQHFRHGPVQENADRLAASGRHCNYLLVVALLLEPPGPPGSRSGLAVAEAEFHQSIYLGGIAQLNVHLGPGALSVEHQIGVDAF